MTLFLLFTSFYWSDVGSELTWKHGCSLKIPNLLFNTLFISLAVVEHYTSFYFSVWVCVSSLLPSCVRSVSSRSMVALPSSSFLRVWQLHSFRSSRLWGVTLLWDTKTHHDAMRFVEQHSQVTAPTQVLLLKQCLCAWVLQHNLMNFNKLYLMT